MGKQLTRVEVLVIIVILFSAFYGEIKWFLIPYINIHNVYYTIICTSFRDRKKSKACLPSFSSDEQRVHVLFYTTVYTRHFNVQLNKLKKWYLILKRNRHSLSADREEDIEMNYQFKPKKYSHYRLLNTSIWKRCNRSLYLLKCQYNKSLFVICTMVG